MPPVERDPSWTAVMDQAVAQVTDHARVVSAFHRQLRREGMPEDAATVVASQYASTLLVLAAGNGDET